MLFATGGCFGDGWIHDGMDVETTGARLETLNQPDSGAPSARTVDADVAGDILDLARAAKAAGLTDEGMRYCDDVTAAVDALRRASAALVRFNPHRQLDDRRVALAFWINVYNAMVIHGALRFGVRREMTEVARFFKRTAYNIGGRPYNLDMIEHGILRGNRGHPLRVVLPQFRPWDDRRALIIRPVDTRIHFALNCGAVSCPPIRHYAADRIDEELELAARSFVNGGGVVVDPSGGGVMLSRIFLWYARDFGWGRRAQLRSVMGYVDADRLGAVRAAAKIGLRYADYDWSFA